MRPDRPALLSACRDRAILGMAWVNSGAVILGTLYLDEAVALWVAALFARRRRRSRRAGSPYQTPFPGRTDTSAAAASGVKPRTSPLYAQILGALASWGLTGSELSARLGVWVYTIKPRLTELVYQGRIEDSGERRKNPRGYKEIVYRIKVKP